MGKREIKLSRCKERKEAGWHHKINNKENSISKKMSSITIWLLSK